MSHLPHPDSNQITVNCAVITVSDTRTAYSSASLSLQTDRSGKLIRELLLNAGHSVVFYEILKDEPTQIQLQLETLGEQTDLDAVIFNGGTGIAPRDTTYDALETLLEKTLPGFGEVFRWLSYQEIGSRAIASRAVAGVYKQKLVFSIPGASGAVKLALEKLILPELVHLVTQLHQ